MRHELKEVREEMKRIGNSTTKMNNHVNFVESVYSKVRNPLNWVLKKISRPETPLPELEWEEVEEFEIEDETER